MHGPMNVKIALRGANGTKNLSHFMLPIGYKDKYIEDTVNTKFISLYIDNNLNWKNRTD